MCSPLSQNVHLLNRAHFHFCPIYSLLSQHVIYTFNVRRARKNRIRNRQWVQHKHFYALGDDFIREMHKCITHRHTHETLLDGMEKCRQYERLIDWAVLIATSSYDLLLSDTHSGLTSHFAFFYRGLLFSPI